jgi:serine/threonine-protein kinase
MAGSAVNLVIAEAATPADAVIPGVVGLTQHEAGQRLRAAGFTIGTVTKRKTREARPGVVLSQSPDGGTRAKAGSAVALVVAEAEPQPCPSPTQGTAAVQPCPS